MAQYRDFSFNEGNYGRAAEYIDASALVLGVKTILLSRKGNFPFHPSIGMNVQKYQFDLLDEIQLNQIKSELIQEITTWIPNFENVFVDVQMVTDDANLLGSEQGMIGITISTRLNSEPLTTRFLLYKDHGELIIVNETH